MNMIDGMNNTETIVEFVTIHDLPEYVTAVSAVQKSNHSEKVYPKDRLLYRGQANESWSHYPALFREEFLYRHEQDMIDDIRRRSPSEFDGLSPFESLVKLQHFGMPTRLLDFTGNPLVALYFACFDKMNRDSAGEVILAMIPMFFENELPIQNALLARLFHTADDIEKNNREVIDQLREKPLASGIIPNIRNERILPQDGYMVFFSYFGEYRKDMFNPIEPTIRYRIRVPAECKEKLLQELSTVGINRASLFPSFESQISYIVDWYRGVTGDGSD